MYMDQKVSSKPDRHDRTRMLGIVDSCTNRSWVIPLTSGETSEITQKLDDWMVHQLGNKQISTLMMDNDPSFVARDMTTFLTRHRITKRFSAAYHQHQNGVAESLWARLVPITTIHIHSAPWLGLDYWPEAMEYANEQSIRRPSKANPNGEVPWALWEGKQVRTDHLRAWGCCCYVHDEDCSSLDPKGRKAYLLGLADNHAEGTYRVVMADTMQVRQSGNVTFYEIDGVSPPDMPDEVNFDPDNPERLRDVHAAPGNQ